MKALIKKYTTQFWALNILHILNDGYKAGILLLLPFIAKELHITLTQVGFLGSIISGFGIILALPAAYIAKKLGGMKALIFALSLYGIGYVATSIASSFLLLLITFSMTGIGFALFHPIGFALIAKWSTKQTRGKQMGEFTALGEVGRIALSVPLTFIIAYLGWHITTFLYAAVALSTAIVFYLLFLAKKETVTVKEKPPIQMSLKAIMTHKLFIFAVITNFFDYFAGSSLVLFLPFLLLLRGIDPSLLGLFTAFFFIGNFAGKTILGRFVDRFTTTRVLVIAELCMASLIILLANATTVIFIILLAIFLGMFTKGTSPIVQTMISESADHHGNFEKTFGIASLVGSIATTLAPIVLGIISDMFGIVTAFIVMAGFALFAIIPAIAFHAAKKTDHA